MYDATYPVHRTQAIRSTLDAGLAALPTDEMRKAFVSAMYVEIIGYDAIADGSTNDVLSWELAWYEEALGTVAELLAGDI